MLNENVKKYSELKKQADIIKAELEALKESIVEDMNAQKQTVFSTEDGVTAKLVTKVTFDYTDEPGMIKWLEDCGLTNYIVKKINTTSLNKELKKSGMLNEGLSPMFVKKESLSLTVESPESK